MKKIALSLFVIAASGGYVWSQSEKAAAPDDPLAATPVVTVPMVDPKQAVVPAAAPPVLEPAPSEARRTGGPRAPEPSPAAANPAIREPVADSHPVVALVTPSPADEPPPPPAPEPVIPLPRLRPAYHPARIEAGVVPVPAAAVIPASMTLTAGAAAYADGTYTGPVVDAYYGLIQIQAIVRGGQLVGIKVLQYPSDRRTSVYINRQALPMLRDEVVSAQSANVDIISGATLTSRAFIRSLSGALRKAQS